MNPNSEPIEDYHTCSNCKFYEERTRFCRRFPPTPLAIEENSKFVFTSTFPKIHLPNVDFCGEFVEF